MPHHTQCLESSLLVATIRQRFQPSDQHTPIGEKYLSFISTAIWILGIPTCSVEVSHIMRKWTGSVYCQNTDTGVSGVNHGTFLHIAHEEGLIRNTSMHAGIRAPVSNKKYDLSNDKACGFNILKARDLDKIGTAGFVQRLRERVQGSKVYISVDIDVLDPAYAPATGTAEVGGWTTRELLTILDGLTGIELIGADVVEVAPVSSVVDHSNRSWSDIVPDI